MRALETIWLDEYLAVSFLIDYLLLAAAARLDGSPHRRGRWAMGAAVGTVYAALALWWPVLEHPVPCAGAAALLLIAAYGTGRRLLRTGGLFLLLSCALAGAASLLGHGTGVRSVLITAALSYGVLSLLLSGQFRHTRTDGELVPLTLSLGAATVTLLALRDSGNTLCDPVTGRSVVVAEGAALLPLLPGVEAEELRDPVALLRRCEGLPLRLLPYRAVGVERGLLAAVRTDRAAWDGRDHPHCLVALSPTPLTDGGGYRALIGREDPP